MDFKNIHIGKLIKTKWKELEIPVERTCNFFKLEEKEIQLMFLRNSLDTDIVLKWSKLLEYDFFRIYSQHIVLYAPQSGANKSTEKQKSVTSLLPVFRKNLYTYEIIDFMLELINTGEKTKKQVIEDYKIPKTTLYKWIKKYKTKH